MFRTYSFVVSRGRGGWINVKKKKSVKIFFIGETDVNKKQRYTLYTQIHNWIIELWTQECKGNRKPGKHF